MPTYIGLLRGVNIAGHKKLPMADLQRFVTSLGFDEARTLLQSGNVVFNGPKKPTAQLENLFEAEVANRLGLTTEVFVRTAGEWQSVIARNPFVAEARRDPGHVVVMALKRAPTAADVKRLKEAHKGPEPFHVDGREVFAYFCDGQGRSKLATMMDVKLGTRGTARNWNTALKLVELAST